MKSLRILLLEDDDLDAELVKAELLNNEFNFVSIIVKTKDEFISGIHNFNPDIILSDYSLPQFTGFEALKIAQELIPDTPFIVVTGCLTEETAVEVMKKGAWDYIIKENLERLSSAIENVLKLKKEKDKNRQVEKQLLKLSSAVTQSPSVIVITNLKGIIEYVNPKFTELTGYTDKEAIGKSTKIMKSGKHSASHYKELWETIKLGKEWHGEFHNRKKNGELFWELATITSIVDSKGNIINYLKVAKDITEQKQAEERLRASEEQYRAVVENSSNGISILGEDYKFVFVNNRLCEILGHPREEIINRDFRVFLDEVSRDFVGEMYSKRRKGEEVPSSYECNVIDKKGEIKRIEITAVIVKDLKNEIKTISQINDITKQRQAELELKQSEQRFRRLFEDLGDAVFVTTVGGSSEGQILEANNAATKQTGYTKDELLKMNIINDLAVSDSSTIPQHKWKESLKKGKTVTTIERKKKKDGTEYWIEVIVTPIRFKGRDASLSINHDITNRMKLEIDLKRALKKATESDRLKSAFLATISHELRTPLNAIIGFSDLIDESLPIDTIIKYSEVINLSGENLLSIVQDLFDISLIESGEIKMVKEEVILQTILNNVYEIIKAKQQRDNKNHIELNMIIPDKSEELIIYTDESKLSQILINLLKNALKFTQEGFINFGYNVETIENASFVKFYVKDTGIGIHKKNQEIIFDIFRQAEDTLNRKYGGTGIGLSISKKLTKLLGGKIWVESEEDNGATFYFTIPINKPNLIDKKVQNMVDNKKWGDDKTILIAEDDKFSFEYLLTILTNSRINIVWAENGKEAISLCKENKNINLVLMDINMPVIDGYEATTRIKKVLPNLPIIAQTAHAIEGDREKVLLAGFDDYISKPINKEELLNKIKKYL